MINLDGKDKRLEIIDEIKSLNLPIFIWGGGTAGRNITTYLRENGIDTAVTYVVDEEYKKQDDDFIHISEYLEKHSQDSVMIFGFYNYKIINKKKEEYRKRIKYLYDLHFTMINDTRLKWDKFDTVSRLPEFEETYEMLSDDKSRETMELYLRAAVNGEFDNLYRKCHEDIAYFNEVTANTEIEVLVDCGAYDGDSIHDFVNSFENYKQIYAIEPDAQNRKKLNDRVNEENIHDVVVFPKGVYKETTVLHFSSNGNSASHMDEEGDILVSVMALDELLSDCNDRLFIKMDIEGSEMDALTGAAETIAKKHPCLAICVYHKETDMIDIPQYINSIVEDGTYNYYIRFHGLDLAELVFYAVPRV